MSRQALTSYLSKVYPNAQIDTEHTIGGQIQFRFDLVVNGKENSIDRTEESASNGLAIFNDIFENREAEIFVLIYEYLGASMFDSNNDFLYQQFPKEQFEKFDKDVQLVNTRFFKKDLDGNEVSEQSEAKVIVGKLPIKDIFIENILKGIAGLELGLDKAIEQRVYFFDPLTDRAFQMYDDRGCYIWSDKFEKIQAIYLKWKDWIINN
jgi:hypothetical protein